MGKSGGPQSRRPSQRKGAILGKIGYRPQWGVTGEKTHIMGLRGKATNGKRGEKNLRQKKNGDGRRGYRWGEARFKKNRRNKNKNEKERQRDKGMGSSPETKEKTWD